MMNGQDDTTASAAVDALHQSHGDRPEARQFDFWIGDWVVRAVDGQYLGANIVSLDLGGHVLREAWTGARGNKGTSVNFHDPATRQWHQVWIDDSGQVTHYVGEMRDGAMRFRAEGFGDADGVRQQRTMDFTPEADGSVRQVIRDCGDGETWTTSFEGIYVRAVE